MGVKTDDGGLLACPRCGDGYLHHGGVQIFDRDREDGPGTIHEHGAMHPTWSSLANPDSMRCVTSRRAVDAEMPGRRGTVRIAFVCEACGSNPVLQIQQHKGGTYVTWL